MLLPYLLCKTTKAISFMVLLLSLEKYYSEANSCFNVQISHAITADIKDISSFTIMDHSYKTQHFWGEDQKKLVMLVYI